MAQTIVAATLQYDTSGAQKSQQDFNDKVSNGTADIKSFRQQMKEATDDLASSIQKYGQFSDQAQEAAKRLGDLKNIAGDAQKVAANFATDGSKGLNAFTNAARGLAGGFTALTGAMALFGTQSEDVQKTLLKVQGALALTEGLNSITDIQKGWQNFTTIVKESSVVQGVYNFVMTGTVAETEAATVATTGLGIAMRTALIATGIGAVIVGITALAIAISNAGKAADEAAKKQKFYDDVIKEANNEYVKAKQSISDLQLQLDLVNKGLETQKVFLENYNKGVGLVLGQVNNFDEALKKISNPDAVAAYVDAMKQRALANIAEGKTAQNEFDAAEARQKIKEAQIIHDKTYLGKNDAQIFGIEDYYHRNGLKSPNDLLKDAHDVNDKIIKDAEDNNKILLGIKTDATTALEADAKKYNLNIIGGGEDLLTKEKTQLDKSLQNNLDKLKVQEDAANEEANRQQVSEDDKTQITILGQEQRIKYLQQYVSEAKKIGGDYYTAALDQEKKAENDLANLRDKFHTQQIQEGETKAEADIKRESEFVNRLKLVWSTGALAGTSVPIAGPSQITQGASNISSNIQSNISGQNDLQNQLNNNKLDDKSKQFAEQNQAIDKQLQERLLLVGNNEAAIIAIEDDAAMQRKKIAQNEHDYKLSLIADTLAKGSELLGKDTIAGKALAIASATINTYVGATEALREKSILPQPFATIQKIVSVAAIIATGLQSVRAIVATPVPGASGAIGSVPNLSSPSAPLSPSVQPQATNTQLNADQLNQIGNATVRAFVIESDVANNRERIERLNRAARLGG